MIDALTKWMLERGALRRAARLPLAERGRFLHRTAFLFAFLAGFSLLSALLYTALCIYIGHVWFSSPPMPDVLPVSQVVLYLSAFAFLIPLFVFLAILGFAGRRLLNSSVA